MKKSEIVLSIVVLFVGIELQSQSYSPLDMTVYYTDVPLFFDGEKDGMYMFVDPVPFNRWMTTTLTPKPIDTALAYLLYDSSYFYGFVEVVDSEIIGDDELGLSIDLAEERTEPIDWGLVHYNSNSFLFSKVKKSDGAPHTYNNIEWRWKDDGNNWTVEFRIPWNMISQTDSFYLNMFERGTFYFDMGIKNDGIEEEFLGFSNDSNTYWHSSVNSALISLGVNVMDKPNPVDTTTELRTYVSQELQIFPNPVGAYLNIHLKNDFDNVSIIDFSGKVLYREENPGHELVISTGFLKPGIYIIMAEGDRCLYQKLVKQ